MSLCDTFISKTLQLDSTMKGRCPRWCGWWRPATQCDSLHKLCHSMAFCGILWPGAGHPESGSTRRGRSARKRIELTLPLHFACRALIILHRHDTSPLQFRDSSSIWAFDFIRCGKGRRVYYEMLLCRVLQGRTDTQLLEPKTWLLRWLCNLLHAYCNSRGGKSNTQDDRCTMTQHQQLLCSAYKAIFKCRKIFSCFLHVGGETHAMPGAEMQILKVFWNTFEHVFLNVDECRPRVRVWT